MYEHTPIPTDESELAKLVIESALDIAGVTERVLRSTHRSVLIVNDLEVE